MNPSESFSFRVSAILTSEEPFGGARIAGYAPSGSGHAKLVWEAIA